jgi:hypothetical protein
MICVICETCVVKMICENEYVKDYAMEYVMDYVMDYVMEYPIMVGGIRESKSVSQTNL